jgi:hypothetical protein
VSEAGHEATGPSEAISLGLPTWVFKVAPATIGGGWPHGFPPFHPPIATRPLAVRHSLFTPLGTLQQIP